MLVLYAEPVSSNCLDDCLRQQCNGIDPASKDACAKKCSTSCLNMAAISPGPAGSTTVNIKKPDAQITHVAVKNVSGDGDTANVKSQIAVTNPYDHSIPIVGVVYTLKCGGQVVASGNINNPESSINKDGITFLDIEMQILRSLVANLVREMKFQFEIDYELEIGFTVQLPIIGRFTLYLENKGVFNLSSLHLGGI
ncbi:hypothetical protein AQUCO_01100366v1 [Aquilegia coerulea]|uniref:Water stress and hypersensitive response domain-containing protein n=1 Tax=Aquilegia coerulea TaxID=218851 RepID=A0A2G5E6U7_AQUCA|nr:hypothetical protein AQUCO_01100366v1 [Aquilegia coerulea]